MKTKQDPRAKVPAPVGALGAASRIGIPPTHPKISGTTILAVVSAKAAAKVRVQAGDPAADLDQAGGGVLAAVDHDQGEE